jgi:carbamoyltransferase
VTSILGISAFYHDSAAALVIDGEIVAAAQEERFTRKKHDFSFPQNAVDYCLSEAGITPEKLNYVGFYDKPMTKFERLIETYIAFTPAGYRSFRRAMPLWLKQKLHLPREMSRGLHDRYSGHYVFADHHESHAASAFFPSPFEQAAILTLDGVGEWSTTCLGIGRGNKIELTDEIRFPHSLGLLYSAFTYYTGFEVNSGEYKVMGLAPYGEPVYKDLILEQLMDLKEDGSFRMDMSYFNYCQGLTMTSQKFDRLFGGPPRKPDARVTRREMDLAASVQAVTEEIMLRMAHHLHAKTGMTNLVLAGGVALNCVGNGRILRKGPFQGIWIQPAAGDGGGALGVALMIWHQLLDHSRKPRVGDSQFGSLLGGCHSNEEIVEFLDSTGVVYETIEDDDALCDAVANAIASGEVVGWFQGRMEFGPRALGSRSILGDAREPRMQRIINMKVKFRESFRPFAPVVLAEMCDQYFQMKPGQESPYMLLVAPVRNEHRREIPAELRHATGIDLLKQLRSDIPAVTHVDYSARVQTVDKQRFGLYRKLLEKFYAQTGCPVMVNTSFNLGWEPIVESPQQAYRTFMSCDLDMLAMGNQIVRKSEQLAFVAGSDADSDETWLVDLVSSPNAAAPVYRDNGDLVCAETGQRFQQTDGILQMFWPHDGIEDPSDVTAQVREFYEKTPFPDYDDHDSVRSLIDKSRAGIYASALDRSIPFNSTVLEVGCGTGQLSNFLGIGFRRVIGADLCLNSLRLGEQFRRQHELNRVRFVQMNLFRPPFAKESFEVVLCNGVLHHTADPYGGFQQLVPLVKPGGHIVIGLYNRYGRLATDARRVVFRMTGNRLRFVDPILRGQGLSKQNVSDSKQRAWFADQYCHPHESKHTFGQILRWFDDNGLQFIRGVPSLTSRGTPLSTDNLFEPQRRGTAFDHFRTQARQIVAGSREGGFFIMIARKPEKK